MTKNAEIKGLDVPIAQLHPLHKRKPQARGFGRILASIKVVGLVEPLCVYREGDHYIILDGYLRYLACQQLGVESIPCLVFRNKEAYTFNRMVSPLSPVQESRMLRKSLEHLDKETVARTFGLSSIRARLRTTLMKRLHPAVLKELDAARISRACAAAFVYVKPERQMAILQEMHRVGDFSPAFARAMVIRTPATLRVKTNAKMKNPWDHEDRKKELCAKLVEVEQRHDFYTRLYRQYVADLIKLCVYVRKLITNERTRAHIEKDAAEILKLFSEIAFDDQRGGSGAVGEQAGGTSDPVTQPSA